MVSADGARPDKPHGAAFEQVAVDFGHRAHQQDIGIKHVGAADLAARKTAYFTEVSKKFFEQRNIFVSNNQHGRLLSRSGSVGVVATNGPAGCGRYSQSRLQSSYNSMFSDHLVRRTIAGFAR